MLTAIRGRKGGPSWSGTLDCMAAHIGLGKSILSPPLSPVPLGEREGHYSPPFFPFPSLVPQGNKEKEKKSESKTLLLLQKKTVEEHFFLKIFFTVTA